MTLHWPLLSILIWLPIVGAVLVLLTGDDRNAGWARGIAIAVAVISVLLCIPLYCHFDASTYHMQYTENVLWIADYGIHYALGVDGISLMMVFLTVYTGLIIILAACHSITKKVAQYMAAFLVLQGMMIGVFEATDAILFYVFWEAMLIPMYLCIGIWGMEGRSSASIKFFIYTFLGSVLMLVSLLYLGIHAGSFNIESLYDLGLPETVQLWIFLSFLLAFAVKVPMWPVHTWLPDAHTQAPAGGSVVLAALMLKMGVYGFLRFSLPITPMASQALEWLMIGLSLMAVVYIGLVAIAQTDMKKLIAYSSISHMGLATLGTFLVYRIMAMGSEADAYMSIEGATIQMIAHAFSSGAMFLGFGYLYDRLHTRHIGDFGGVASRMPVFAAFFMLFCLSNVGMPGTAGFVGEFMVLLAAFKASVWVALVATLTIVFSAAYTLWMYAKVFFGKVVHDNVNQLEDIGGMEIFTFSLLAIAVLAVGLYPGWILQTLHASVGHLLIDSLKFNPTGFAV